MKFAIFLNMNEGGTCFPTSFFETGPDGFRTYPSSTRPPHKDARWLLEFVWGFGITGPGLRMCFILDIVLNHIRPIHSLADLRKVKPFNDTSHLHLLNMSGMSFDKRPGFTLDQSFSTALAIRFREALLALWGCL